LVPRVYGVGAHYPVFAPHAFRRGRPRVCPLRRAGGGARPGRTVPRDRRPALQPLLRCTRARILADLRDQLHEARVTRRDPQRYYHAADVAIRLAARGAIRRTLASTDPRAFLA
jgi:hypothetical protein